jgi:hypothetical protein
VRITIQSGNYLRLSRLEIGFLSTALPRAQFEFHRDFISHWTENTPLPALQSAPKLFSALFDSQYLRTIHRFDFLVLFRDAICPSTIVREEINDYIFNDRIFTQNAEKQG